MDDVFEAVSANLQDGGYDDGDPARLEATLRLIADGEGDVDLAFFQECVGHGEGAEHAQAPIRMSTQILGLELAGLTIGNSEHRQAVYFNPAVWHWEHWVDYGSRKVWHGRSAAILTHRATGRTLTAASMHLTYDGSLGAALEVQQLGRMVTDAGTDHSLLTGDQNTYGPERLAFGPADIAPHVRGTRWVYNEDGELVPDRGPARRLAAYGLVDTAHRLGNLAPTAGRLERIDTAWTDAALAAGAQSFRVVDNPNSDHRVIRARYALAGPSSPQ